MALTRWVFTGLLLLIALPSTAKGDGLEDAKRHFAAGMAAYGLLHYDEAAIEFEKAYAAQPGAELLFNAARAHHRAGHTRRALDLYQSYVGMYQAEDASEVEREVAALKLELEAEKSAPPPPVAAPPAPVIVAPPPAPAARAPLVTPVVVANPPPANTPRSRIWIVALAGAAVVVVAGIIIGALAATASSDPMGSLGSVRGN